MILLPSRISGDEGFEISEVGEVRDEEEAGEEKGRRRRDAGRLLTIRISKGIRRHKRREMVRVKVNTRKAMELETLRRT